MRTAAHRITRADYSILCWAARQAQESLGSQVGGPGEQEYRDNLAKLQLAMRKVQSTQPLLQPMNTKSTNLINKLVKAALAHGAGGIMGSADDFRQTEADLARCKKDLEHFIESLENEISDLYLELP